ncbi:AP2-like ethylene-responsive transcription factor AIL5 [Zingiber officinale]|uniref:AP2-like ethylene-responsive transcription factor AIL5 n=1 Tax=Zingiber officinale TaxID=94328 RepID=UPI001C4CCA63|nr:AP2-like ethylene-responsive transcription factor AIL5 [Zingiber officinale]
MDMDMDIDMDASSHNWLAFSLAQQPCSLLEAFSSSSSSSAAAAAAPSAHHDGGVEAADEETNAATELVALASMGPKLEDFLAAPLGRYSAYDSELKSIAAAGYIHSEQPVAAAAPSAESARKSTSSATAADTFGQRTSIYRGVTRHRWTGRYEAHLWDNSCRREGQSRKGRQVYLGGYDKEDKAARAYDLAALKYWGPTTTTNFPISNYEREMEEMKNMTRQEFVASLRRKSSGFSRGASIYRGVTRHHQHGRWQARIGRVAGNKDLYLGTFSTQEEAAEAYDIAAIKFRGLNAVTNFDMSRYDVNSIVSSNLPISGLSGKSSSKPTQDSPSPPPQSSSPDQSTMKPPPDHEYWSLLAFHPHHHPHHNPGFGLFPPALPMMDFASLPNPNPTKPIHQEAGIGLACYDAIQQYQQDHQFESNAYNYDHASSYMESWIAPPPSSSSKPTAAAFPAAIFGME